MSEDQERKELVDRFSERIDELDNEIDERVDEGKKRLKQTTSGIREKAGKIGEDDAGK
jgi:hypothetical protein